jgi:hypothetical protein
MRPARSHAASLCALLTQERPMFEIVMLGLGVALFALAGLYILACARL